MNGENINKYPKRPRILVAPLDWGLGHATRCIPVIRVLCKHADVVIAAEGPVVVLLQKEFPNLQFLPLPGYRIKYSPHKSLFAIHLILQIPKILSAIRKENQWLKNIVVAEKIDAVVSDNRPGLFHNNIPCVYISHQLSIQTGNRYSDNWVRKLHYHYINKFTICWVPDNKTGKDLAGVLSHPKIFPRIPVAYIGILSRFKKSFTTKKYDFLLLISGPEPQRTQLENLLLNEMKKTTFSFAMVRGLPAEEKKLDLNNERATVFNHLPAEALAMLIQESETVIARSGYSTVMDLVRWQQKAILIPTPGQTEQEYLAKYGMQQGLFYAVKQDEFSLPHIVEKMHSWQPDFKDINCNMQEDLIEKWVQEISIKAS